MSTDAGGMPGSRVRVAVLALVVGTVLADSAIVTLALPEILRELGGTVTGVAWVLIAYNLVLALAAVPVAHLLTRRDPAPWCAAGIVAFAGASAACAVANSMEVLIAARAVQALGGALAIVGCLELLVVASGARRGIARWTAAGVVGTAAGPVAGGLLTEAISWQSIFIVQVPIALLAVPVALSLRHAPSPALPHQHATPGTARTRPALAPNVALLLLSAALTAALFLLVLLLVEGWQRSPATAAVTVSVVPLAAFAAAPLARVARAGLGSEAIAGASLVAGGLAGLALLPSADLAWTIAPQALVGLGLGLTVDSLTTEALRGRAPRALHGGWTIAARHAGVVLGLAILTPVFTADLRDAQVPTQEAITALMLDAPLTAANKIELARGLGDQLLAEAGRVPDLHPAFQALRVTGAEREAALALEANLDGQLERAANRAFRDSFLLAAAMALAAVAAFLPRPRTARASHGLVPS
ncbi:MAG: MFS transporter [Sporichthyaceae bacterium]